MNTPAVMVVSTGFKSRKYPKLEDQRWLRRKYVEERLSTYQIARLVGSSVRPVCRALRAANIKTRNARDAAIATMDRKGFDASDLVGRKFGLLTVQRLASTDWGIGSGGRRRGVYFYDCLCDCGQRIQIRRLNLLHLHTRSCGCLKNRKAEKNPGWKGHGKISGYLWSHIRNHATSRNLQFSITIEDAWRQFEEQGGRCALTGWKLSIEHSSKRKSTRTASLDRINSKKGYTPENIQWLHKDVNQIKWDLDDARFIELCVAVVTHNNRRKQ